jgi:hypothetical protein
LQVIFSLSSSLNALSFALSSPLLHNLNMAIGGGYATNLRRELCFRNAGFARQHGLAHVSSHGREPVIVYAPNEGSGVHGNFFPASYRAIQKNALWRKRLDKIHTQARASLPKCERRWRELDSCTSSDALLMSIFCCPRVLRGRNCAAMLGVEPTARPRFGYRPRVPLANGHIERTEVDLILGNLLIEAKLTESDFQTQSAALVENYRDLEEVFDVSELPRITSQPIDPFADSEIIYQQLDPRPVPPKLKPKYVSYQLIRNVLAAHAGSMSFCVITDQRRPDLIERWHAIMRCIRSADLRTRCKVLTWQELASELSSALQAFLAQKYGIGVRTTCPLPAVAG